MLFSTAWSWSPFASRRVRQYANSDSGMNSSLEKHSGRGGEAGQCLARSVVDTLAEEPALEAVTIDRARRKISVATLGRVPQGGIGRLTERITREFEAAQAVSTGRQCNLLTGQDDCRSCDRPLSETERKTITIQNEGQTHHHRPHHVPDRADLLALARHSVSQGRPARR